LFGETITSKGYHMPKFKSDSYTTIVSNVTTHLSRCLCSRS